MDDNLIKTARRLLQFVIPTNYEYTFMSILTNKIIYYEYFFNTRPSRKRETLIDHRRDLYIRNQLRFIM